MKRIDNFVLATRKQDPTRGTEDGAKSGGGWLSSWKKRSVVVDLEASLQSRIRARPQKCSARLSKRRAVSTLCCAQQPLEKRPAHCEAS